MELPKGINVLITGTPGTGKTSMAAMLSQELEEFTHLEIGQVVKDQKFYTAYDPELDTHLIEEEDEEHLLDYLEPIMVREGSHVVDYHSSGLFPERWFHLVVVLHASTEVLFERLTSRQYSDHKRAENMEAEIQCICEEEAREAYQPDIILVRQNDTLEQMAETIDLLRDRIEELRVTLGVSREEYV